MEKENKKKKRKGMGPLELGIIMVAVAVLTFSVCQLISIQGNYQGAQEEYKQLADAFVETKTDNSASEAASAGESTPAKEKKEEQVVQVLDEASEGGTSAETTASVAAIPVPFSVDWAGLKAVNQEIVGWLHVDGLPHIHYPICKGNDNSYYLNHTFRREEYPSGSLFMDKNNAADFSNALTFVYGHRMDDHSMFGDLRALEDQALVDANPYFWIYTPEGVFCYRIFSVFEEPAESDVFAYHFETDEGFLAWAKNIRARSMVDTHTDVQQRDKVIGLSTCTKDRVRRCLVFGKCISIDRPGPDEEIEVPEDEKAAGREAANAESAGSKKSSKSKSQTSKKSASSQNADSTASYTSHSDWEFSQTTETESFTEF